MGAWYTSQPFRRPPGDIFVVSCKGCVRAVPAGVDKFPKDNIVVYCPLCGDLRQYRPSEVYLGWPSSRLGDRAASLRNHRPAYRRRSH